MNSQNTVKNQTRVPIIAVMGHVDHGKTSILDAIRGTKVQAGEAGGITQNTRAHLIIRPDGTKLTFIDTPGHEAFSGMRSRGAKVTDIVMLVVAADDGVQPQTIESIKFAKEAKVPIVVAVNKMDAPGADPAKVKQELSQYDVLVEEFGGDVMINEVSALKKEGLEELLDTLALQAEIFELKSAKLSQETARGFVLESNLNKNLGPVTMVLIKAGSVKDGDYIAAQGNVYKVRKVLNEQQAPVGEAGEGEPVWIIGANEVLNVGEVVNFFDEEKKAKQFIREGAISSQDEEGEADSETESLEDSDLLAMLVQEEEHEQGIKKLNVIVKTDTKGTLEAVTQKLVELNDDEVEVNILRSETGDITLKDVELAKTSHAIIIAFQVGIPSEVEKIAKRDRVLFRKYKIIYELIDEVDDAMTSLVAPQEEEVEISRAKVKQVFVLSNGKKVAGSEVIKGNVLKGYSVYVERSGEEVGRGKIVSLKQNKNEVKEVKKGQDCGIIIEPEANIEVGDEVVCYKIEKI